MSPQPAMALEANMAAKMPAPRVVVIARAIAFMKFLFLPRANAACILKSAIHDQKMASAKKVLPD